MNARPTQPSPWVLASEPTSLGDPTGLVTLVDGQTFCLSGRSGDFSTNPTHGVFFADMRVLSQARLLVGGVGVEPLAVSLADASGCNVRRSFDPGQPDTNPASSSSVAGSWARCGTSRSSCATPVAVAAVGGRRARGRRRLRRRLRHQGRPTRAAKASTRWRSTSTACCSAGGSATCTARPSSASTARPCMCRHAGSCGASPSNRHSACACCSSISPSLSATPGSSAGTTIPTCPTPRTATRVGWRRCRSCAPPTGSSSAAYDRSIEDIGALRLHDPTGRRRPVIAAGAPWYMTLFGRDALISAYMALPIDPTLAIGVLEALAELQGREIDLDLGRRARSDHARDPLPRCRRADADRRQHVLRLGRRHPAVRRCCSASSAGGVSTRSRCARCCRTPIGRWRGWSSTATATATATSSTMKTSDRGLTNQGWKDSADGIRYRDGPDRRGSAGVVRGAGLRLRRPSCPSATIAARLGEPDIVAQHERARRRAEGAVQPRLLARGARLVRGRARAPTRSRSTR